MTKPPPLPAQKSSQLPSVKPGQIHYVAGALVIVLGLIFAIQIVYRGITGFGRSMVRAKMPGETTMRLEETGRYTIYHEYVTVMDGVRYSDSPVLTGLRLRLECYETGDEIALEAPRVTTDYSTPSRAGYGVSTFSIGRPGRYTLSGWYPDEEDEENGRPIMLVVGRGLFSGMMRTIGWAMLVVFVSFGLGVAMIVLTFIGRSRAANRATLEPEGD